MKKIIALTGCCLAALTLLCGCGGSENTGDGNNVNKALLTELNVNGEVNDLMSVEELVDFHLNGNKYPDGFVFPELKGYGRVINSSLSRDEACSTARKHFNSGYCTTAECRSEVETELFYGLYVKWEYNHDGESYFYDENVVSFNKNVYDAGTKVFGTDNPDTIKSVIDYLYYSHTYEIYGSKVYSSSVSLSDGKCVYTAYVLTVCGGDWGLQDELTLLKTVCEVDLQTGRFDHSKEQIGVVFIDGECTHGGGVVGD